MRFAEHLRLRLRAYFSLSLRAAGACLLAVVLPSPAAASGEEPWNLFSPAEDARLGAELDAWLVDRIAVVDDPRLDRYLQRFATRLEQAAGPFAFPLRFRLLAATEPYALALPGGEVLLSTGLVTALADEAQLAGVLAHVAAHAQLRHPTRAVSKAERFKAQGAIVVSRQSDKALLQALDEFGLDLYPGAPLMRHDEAQEAEADTEAGQWLDAAGYGSAATGLAFERLRLAPADNAARFLERHPGAHGIRAPPGDFDPRRPLASTRKFAALQARAGSLAGSAPGMDQALAWAPPAETPKLATRHERFITRYYQFDYPNDWRPGKPGFDATIEVSPRGGMADDAGQAPQVGIGLLAGAPPLEGATASATEILLARVDHLRPGLRPAADQRGIAPRGPQSESILLEGISPLDGQPELVWAVSRKLQDHFFYLLMVAPEPLFSQYRPEFEAIYRSIAFDGPPATVGRAPGEHLAK